MPASPFCCPECSKNHRGLNLKYPASFVLSQTMKVFRLFIDDSFSRFEKVCNSCISHFQWNAASTSGTFRGMSTRTTATDLPVSRYPSYPYSIPICPDLPKPTHTCKNMPLSGITPINASRKLQSERRSMTPVMLYVP